MISPPIFVAVVCYRRTDARGKASVVLIPILYLQRGYGWHKYEDVSSPMAESLSQSEDDYVVRLISYRITEIKVSAEDIHRPPTPAQSVLSLLDHPEYLALMALKLKAHLVEERRLWWRTKVYLLPVRTV